MPKSNPKAVLRGTGFLLCLVPPSWQYAIYEIVAVVCGTILLLFARED